MYIYVSYIVIASKNLYSGKIVMSVHHQHYFFGFLITD